MKALLLAVVLCGTKIPVPLFSTCYDSSDCGGGYSCVNDSCERDDSFVEGEVEELLLGARL